MILGRPEGGRHIICNTPTPDNVPKTSILRSIPANNCKLKDDGENMLEFMRKQAGSWIIKIFMGAIITVFVFWGVGSFRDKNPTSVASVDGESISYEEYQNAYNNILEQLRKNLGGNLDDNIIKMFRVKEQALNGLIDQKMLLKEANRLGLLVSTEEMIDAINKISVFKTNGYFDSSLYRKILDRARLTPEEFEASHQKRMVIEKLRQMIANSVKVSELEVRQWYAWVNRSVKVEYVAFLPEKYKKISVSDEEIEIFFNTHMQSYKTEPEVKAEYLLFDPDHYKDSVAISDEKLMEYYGDTPEEFVIPATVHARHILIKTKPDDDPEKVEEKKEQALNISKIAKEGKDFAELAKEYSQGPTGDNGGDLGTFEKQDMVPPFSDKAFSMEAGEISDPVLTRFGWHIIKVEKINKESLLPFVDAKDKIHDKLAGQQAADFAYEEAERVYNTSFDGEDLKNVAKEYNIEIHKTDFFTKSGGIKGVADSSKFASIAFSLENMEISDIEDFKGKFYIIQPVEKIPAKVPELEKVKKRVKINLIKEKKDTSAKEDAEEFLAALKNGDSMAELSEKYELSPQETLFFKRNDSSKETGLGKKGINEAFILSEKEQFPENIIEEQGGYYIIKFKERKEPDPELFTKEEENIKSMITREKQRRHFDLLLSELRSRSKIILEKDFF